MAAERPAEARRRYRAVRRQGVAKLTLGGGQLGVGLMTLAHVANSGERGLSERARRYALSEARWWPVSASIRDRTSHADQLVDSSAVARRTAISAPAKSCCSSSTSATWSCADSAPGSIRSASRASVSASEVLPLADAAWLRRTA